MADISNHVDPIAALVYEQYEKRNALEKPRAYLGGSVVGKECARALWYGFRWARREQFDGRTLRLFQTGHMAEGRFVADLRSIGCEVWDCDPRTGRQFTYKDHGGHMQGSLDGVAVGVPSGGKHPHLLEFKTHSAKSFAELKKKGVKAAKYQHFAQMQVYMGWAKLPRALYVAVNKDDESLYFERLEFDSVEFEKLRVKAERVIFTDQPPARISDDPKYYLCNWCTFKEVCHGRQVPDVSCRTCVHATPEPTGDARWSCAKHTPDRNIGSIPIEVQRRGCNDHLPLPWLVTYADAIDAGDGWILFQRQDNGRKFMVWAVNADVVALEHDVPRFTTHELAAARDHRAIADPEIEKFRTTFNGTIVG